MIYYPLCTLMSANIKDILLITTNEDKKFSKTLGNGSQWGISISYKTKINQMVLQKHLLLEKTLLESCSFNFR